MTAPFSVLLPAFILHTIAPVASATCAKDTGHHCRALKCHRYRQATCDSGHCKCPQDFCALDGVCVKPFSEPIPDFFKSKSLREYPMIMSHDSGSSYMPGGVCTPNLLNNYLVTQPPGPITIQLECGARVLDLRPYYDGTLDILVTHHGAVPIPERYHDIVPSVVAWANSRPGDLVIIAASHCNGDKCKNETFKVFNDLNITLYQNPRCGDIARMSVGDALSTHKLDGGGSVLALWGCIVPFYNSSIACYSQEYTKVVESCHGKEQHYFFDAMWEYMDVHTNSRPPAFLWTAQALWQQSASSIAAGSAHHSCILSDITKSGLNRMLAAKLLCGNWKNIGILEVDNVCDHGIDILQALRLRFGGNWTAPANKAECYDAIVNSCKRLPVSFPFAVSIFLSISGVFV